MKLVLIRHGEPDYGPVSERNFIGHGRALAQLTATGREQAETASRDQRLRGAALIVSSPYTRALQTAAILSKNTGLSIAVETDLQEWLPDLHFRCDSGAYEDAALREFVQNAGERRQGSRYDYEGRAQVAQRAYKALQPYGETYEKIIVVAHGVILRQFVPAPQIPHCGILETDFDRNFKDPGFCPEAYALFL